jgi:hypothetical protein
VYGPGALLGPRKQRNADGEVVPGRRRVRSEEHIRFANRDTVTGITIEELSNAWFGRLIPLERFGFRRRSQRVYSRRWEVYITIGEKLVVKGGE